MRQTNLTTAIKVHNHKKLYNVTPHFTEHCTEPNTLFQLSAVNKAKLPPVRENSGSRGRTAAAALC